MKRKKKICSHVYVICSLCKNKSSRHGIMAQAWPHISAYQSVSNQNSSSVTIIMWQWHGSMAACIRHFLCYLFTSPLASLSPAPPHLAQWEGGRDRRRVTWWNGEDSDFQLTGLRASPATLWQTSLTSNHASFSLSLSHSAAAWPWKSLIPSLPIPSLLAFSNLLFCLSCLTASALLSLYACCS